MNYFRTFKYFFLLLTIISCKNYKEGLFVKKHETQLPIKLLIFKKEKDSTKVEILIPHKVELQNNYENELKLSFTGFSLSGGNIYGTNGSSVFNITDSLGSPPYKLKFSKRHKEKFDLYVSYRKYINNKEKDSIIKYAVFAQHKSKYKRPVYNIGNLQDTKEWLDQKIPDSIRGYIRFNLRNMKTGVPIYKNVPATF